MPTVHLKTRDIVLAYEDSGVPPNSTDYTTVFLIHPFLFNARAFQKVFPYAGPSNLRFIAPHMREYDQSTPYTEEELELFYSSDLEEQETSLRVQALEVADLITYFIEHESLPAPRDSNGVTAGGVHIVGWSAGSAQVFSLLANISALDKSISDLLERYIGTVILADCSSMCYGIPEPTRLYHPFRDTSIPQDQVYSALLTFISTYFEPIDDLASVDEPSLQKRKAIAEVSPNAEFTITTFPPKEFADITDYEALGRVGPGMVDWMVYAENVRRALLDTQGHWKNVKAVLTWGTMSFWPTAWGVKGIAELLEVPPDEGLQRRDIQIVRMEGGNHLFMWDKPKEAVELILANIQ